MNYGTHLLIQHDIVLLSSIAERILPFSKDSPEETQRDVVEPIRKQGINIIRVCEGKKYQTF